MGALSLRKCKLSTMRILKRPLLYFWIFFLFSVLRLHHLKSPRNFGEQIISYLDYARTGNGASSGDLSCPPYTTGGEYQYEQLERYWSIGEEQAVLRSIASSKKRRYRLNIVGFDSCSNDDVFQIEGIGEKVTQARSEGEIELIKPAQVKEFVSNITKKMKYSTVKCSHEAEVGKTCDIQLEISEKEVFGEGNRNATSGGSNFRVELHRAGGKWVCPVKDFFNGTYIVKCPFFAPNEANKNIRAFKIFVYLMYIDFVAYISSSSVDTNPLDIPLVEFDIKEETPLEDLKKAENYPENRQRITGWIQTEANQWTWLEDGVPLKPLNLTDMSQCIGKLHNLIMIGSSHLRFMFDEIAIKFGVLPETDMHVLNGSSVYFRWNPYAANLSRQIGWAAQNIRDPNSKDVWAFMCGSWEFYRYDVTYYVKNSSEEILTQLGGLVQEPKLGNPRVLWINNIAYPTNDAYERGKRNNFAISAANYWIGEKLKARGVEIFDSFAMSYPRNNETVCRMHYLCRDRTNRIPIGDVGRSILHSWLTKACQLTQ